MIYILLGFLLVSIAVNLYFYKENKRIRDIVNDHAKSLTVHVQDTDAKDDDL